MQTKLPNAMPFTDWANVPIIIDLAYASVLLGRSVSNLKLLALNKELPAFKLGKEWRIEKDTLRDWIEEQKALATTRV